MKFLTSLEKIEREKEKKREGNLPCEIGARRDQFFRDLYHARLSNDFPYSFSCSKRCAHLKVPQTTLVPLLNRSTKRNEPRNISKLFVVRRHKRLD